MSKITFLPDNITFEAEPGTLVSKAAEQAGVVISLPCAGRGICGKCLVQVEDGAVEFENNGKLSDDMVAKGFVLACKSKVGTGDVAINVGSRLEDEKGAFADAFNHMEVREELFPKERDISPLCLKKRVTVAPAEMLDGLGDYDRLRNAVTQVLEVQDIALPISLLRTLPDVLREQEGSVCLWYRLEGELAHIVDISAQDRADYGLCIDIGTTTVAVQVVDIYKDVTLGGTTSYNAQIERGLDVISRIAYAKNAQRIEEMRELVLKTINTSIDKLAGELEIECRDIRNISVAGNTTMTEMLLGITPEYIRLEPYTPAVFGTPLFTAADVGIEANPQAFVLVAPNVGSYVGGDITSGILCTDFALDSEELCLFIDIGTNGEIVFGNNDFLLSCACSAGPAFEGGGIECGMRASEGAVETIMLDEGTALAFFTVIGGNNIKPQGICGSGLISLVAQLLELGVIDQRGKFDRSGKFSSVTVDGKQARYYITQPEGDYRGVYLTEMDIDNLIRAKAAIFSACRTMLASVEMDFDCISKIYIAGGFGRYIDVEKAQAIGLLPALGEEHFEFIGNSSLVGTRFTLVSARHREKELELAGKVTYIDLSTEAGYMDEYVSAMFLPHTDASLFRKG
ncbi:ASKHA domain-containing protein [Christensenellaceae bacterium OttesenSCG-928-K19]|nr:ASKHA domain-containing protein [Christensenellaceae bacterium OttesenSCG-928-K19]